ncbi:hypothetical protein HAX54_028400 [Datura stramonium]|uniref:Uncharacterized protein n=1 Tax=Datura stramonium TaxID=4076 RepID=A0ABS8V441_DATST|nr:hypothetical protein [Datura stramonium]
MEEGGAELRDTHITKCRVWQGVSIVGQSFGKPSHRPPSVLWCCRHPVPRAHRVACGRESGNSGEWPCTRVSYGRQLLVDVSELNEWFQKRGLGQPYTNLVGTGATLARDLII